MKKIIFIAAIAALIACGNKSKEMAANANNLVQQKTEIPESLNNEEAVVKQVKAVYDTLRTLVRDVDYDFVIFNGDCLPEPVDYAEAARMIHNWTRGSMPTVSTLGVLSSMEKR